MIVSEFLKLVPGPTALAGAILERPDGMRLKAYAPFNLGPNGCSEWVLVERPPLYQDPTARYCGWCKEALYTAYSLKGGLTPGWCPTHGKDALVLHASFNPLTMDEVFWVPIEAQSKKYRAQTPAEDAADTAYFRKNLFEALKVPKEFLYAEPMSTCKAADDQHSQLLERLGFSSREEFRRLAGTRRP